MAAPTPPTPALNPAPTNDAASTTSLKPTAAKMLTSPSLPADRAAWTEADYELALVHISTLQDQIDALRDTIPSLVRPLAALQPSRQQPPPDTGLGPGLRSRLVSARAGTEERRAADDRAARRDGARRNRLERKVLDALKEGVKRDAAGIAALQEAWREEGTQVLLKAGREDEGKEQKSGSNG